MSKDYTKLHRAYDEYHDVSPFVFSVLLFYLRSTGSTDAGKEVGAENTDSEHCHSEGDDEVNKGRENLANLEVDASDRHLELSDTLAGCCGGGQERSDDALRDGGEELGHNSAEVDGGGDDDNILGIEHLFVGLEKKTDSCKAGKVDIGNMDKRERKVQDAICRYQSCPKDALATLKFYYDLHPNDEEERNPEYIEACVNEILYGGDYIRNDDGYIMVKATIEYKKEELDNLFYYQHSRSFIRAMNRMKMLKEELVAAAWHPDRIAKILELGGHDALDNFAGL